jgi:hypothetical protein
MAKDPFPCYSRLCGRIRCSRSLYRVEATSLFPPDKPDRLRHPHEDFDEADCFEPLDPLAHLGARWHHGIARNASLDDSSFLEDRARPSPGSALTIFGHTARGGKGWPLPRQTDVFSEGARQGQPKPGERRSRIPGWFGVDLLGWEECFGKHGLSHFVLPDALE